MRGKHIKDLADQKAEKVLIYAGDGRCYWKQGGCGYTDPLHAGTYTREEAFELAGHCGPEKRIELHDVPTDHIPTLYADRDRLRAALTKILRCTEPCGEDFGNSEVAAIAQEALK